MLVGLVVRRVLKKYYNKFIEFTYRLNIFLGFRNGRYVYRLITGSSGFLSRHVSEEELIEYIDRRLVIDFKSNRLTVRGFYVLLGNIEVRASYRLHCKLSKVLYQSRFTSAKLKIYDSLNDAMVVRLITDDSFCKLAEFKDFVVSNKDTGWSFSYLYRLVNILFLEERWSVLRSLAEACIACNQSNLQVNKKYLISLARLGHGDVTGYFNNQLFRCQSFTDQLEILEAFSSTARLDDLCFSDNGREGESFYAILFRLFSSEKSAGSGFVYSNGVEATTANAAKYIEFFYREKFLFICKELELLERLADKFVCVSSPFFSMLNLMRAFKGRCGGDGWEDFIDSLHAQVDVLEYSDCFSHDFLQSIGYTDKNILRREGSSVGRGRQRSVKRTLLVCNTKMSNAFFDRLRHRHKIDVILEYGSVRQVDIDFDPLKIIPMSVLMPTPGAPLDMQVYSICNKFSTDYFDVFSIRSGFDVWEKDFVREVFALAFEDLFYGHTKRLATLVEYVKVSGFNHVVIPYRQQDFALACSLAHALKEMLDVECVLEREYGLFDRGRYFTFAPPSDFPVSSLSSTVREYSNYRFKKGGGEVDSMLLLSSLGDAAYYKSAIELLKTSDYKVNYVFNLGDKIVDRSFIGDKNILIDDELFGVRRGLKFAFPDLEGIALPSLMKGGNLYAYSKIFHFVFSNFLSARLVRVKNHIDIVLDYMGGKPLSSIVTIPGRAPVARGLTLIAIRSEIKSVDVQAFFISPMPRYKGSLADSYCAITRDQLDLYVNYHKRKADQRLYRIGSLMMDNQLSSVFSETMESARSEYGIALDKFVVFFAEQHGDGGYSFDIAEHLISSLSASMHLIIKLHPRSPIVAVDNLVSVVKRYGKSSQVIVTQSGHLYKLIVASDVVVTQFSNVGLEAAVLRKKVLSVLISGDEPVLDFGALGIADVVYTLEDMISYINGLVYSGCSGTAPYLLSNPELGDGQSAHRVIEISRGMGFYHESTDKL
ncbi:hypothetical protein L3X16_17135 [Pseudomonas stutzeri]|nr:hypothetical protein [Stutzerimonas stutzeri]